MGWKSVFSIIFILLVVALLIFYWFIPFGEKEFFSSGNSNFSIGNVSSGMQFYENMRFPSPNISYRIENCPLQKEDDMERGFSFIDNLTVLKFYPVSSDEEIFVTCSSKERIEGGLFIAGEGGPVDITETANYNVIFYGEILLIKDSECSEPNVAIHELLHVLGFNHSENSNNIMYPVSKCSQTIGEDIPQLLNKLYSVPSYPDLSLGNISAVMHGKYLNANFTIRNDGLKDSGAAKIKVYADDKQVKEFDLEPIKVGYGRVFSLTNLMVPQFNVEKIMFSVETDFNELSKDNNKVTLEIKN